MEKNNTKFFMILYRDENFFPEPEAQPDLIIFGLDGGRKLLGLKQGLLEFGVSLLAIKMGLETCRERGRYGHRKGSFCFGFQYSRLWVWIGGSSIIYVL